MISEKIHALDVDWKGVSEKGYLWHLKAGFSVKDIDDFFKDTYIW